MIVIESPVKSMTSQLQSCTLEDFIETPDMSNNEATGDYVTRDVTDQDKIEDTSDKNEEPINIRVSPLKRDRRLTRAKTALRSNGNSNLEPNEKIMEKVLVSPKKKTKQNLEADEKQASDERRLSANQNSENCLTNQILKSSSANQNSGSKSTIQVKRSLKFEHSKENGHQNEESKSQNEGFSGKESVIEPAVKSQHVKESFKDDINQMQDSTSGVVDQINCIPNGGVNKEFQVSVENKLHQKVKNLKPRRSKSVDLFGNQVDLSSESSDSKLTQGNRSAKTRKSRKQKSIDDLSIVNSKVTDFYQYRRSDRRLGCKIWTKEDFYEKLVKENCQDGLKIVNFPEKGRGVVATKTFERNDFVVEYRGDLITPQEAKMREEKFENDPEIGCYMYYFMHGGVRYCIDATRELESYGYGRLLNHSRKKANCRTKSITVDGGAKLILIANRTINEGEEMLYDYGDRSKTALSNHPWLAQ